MIVASASAPYERNTLRGFADLELGGHERPRVFPKLSNSRPRLPGPCFSFFGSTGEET